MRSFRLAAAAALSCTALVALTGCSLLGGGNEPERDEEGDITEAADADAFAIRVGDCLESMDWGGGELSTVPVIPCAEAHESEVYAATDLPEGDFPGTAEIESQADEYCYGEFTGFVGVAWDESAFEYGYLSPTQESWEQADDREILCVIWDPSGPTTGSLAGVARGDDPHAEGGRGSPAETPRPPMGPGGL
jgi:hypothetical protein